VAVGLEVVDFAGFGVSVEDKVDAAGFLVPPLVSFSIVLFKIPANLIFYGCPSMCLFIYLGEHTLAAKAIHLEANLPVDPPLVVIIPNLQADTNSFRSSTFPLVDASSRFSLYGSAGLLPTSAFEKLDILRELFLTRTSFLTSTGSSKLLVPNIRP
jgi:hypothetical protein